MKASQKKRLKATKLKRHYKNRKAAGRDYWRVVYFLWACESLRLMGRVHNQCFNMAQDIVCRLHGLKNGTRL